jgi:hypothetical protein
MLSINKITLHVRKILSQAKNTPLYVSYLSNLDSILNRVQSYSTSKRTFSEATASEAFRALSALIFHLSRLYLAFNSANTSFHLLMRSLELYVTGFLLAAGKLEMVKFYDKNSKQSEYKLCLKGTSEKINGFGPLWHLITKNKYINNKSTRDKVFGLIDVRNAHILGHGLEFNTVSHANSSSSIVKTVIGELESRIPKSNCKWLDLHDEFEHILSFKLGENFTTSFNEYLGVECL